VAFVTKAETSSKISFQEEDSLLSACFFAAHKSIKERPRLAPSLKCP
jgi:hypothetical protein